MSDSLGQGFTASIVNSIPNYLSADQSVLGQIGGVTGSIQYVKLVWGGSGEANFVSESGADPTALPISLNNADNWWLLDSILGSITKVNGNTAFRVSIGEGITISGVTLQVGTGMTLTGVNTGVVLGITAAGRIGITADWIPVRNYRSLAGVTESIWVTGGMYVLGGTVGLNSANLSVNLSSGVTIAGFSGNLANAGVGVTFGNITFGTMNANISSFTPGATVGVALTTPGGTFFPGGYLGIPVFGVNGATAVGVTFSGTPGVSLSGVTVANGYLGVTFTGSLSGTISLPATGVTMHGTGGPNSAVGVTFSGISFSSLQGVTFPRVRIIPNEIDGTTFGVVFTDLTGSPLGICGNAGVVGIPVFGVTGATAINVTIVGGLSGINITGVSFGSTFQISGGTITRLQGGTLDVVSKIMAFGSAITIGNGTFGAWLAGGSASFHMSNPSASPGFIKLASFQDASNTALIDHLKGLTVTMSGFGSSGLVIAGISLEGGRYGPTGATSLGVTFSQVVVKDLPALPASYPIQGNASSRSDQPVGVTFTGIWGHTFSRDTANALGVTLLGVAVEGGALSVSVVGGLSGITVSGISFPDRFGISGGTFNAILGGTIDIVRSVGFVSGGSFNINNPAIGISFDKRSYYGITFGAALLKPSGGAYDNIENGIPIVGITNGTLVGVTIAGVTIVPSLYGGLLGVTFRESSFSVSLPTSGITLSGATFHFDPNWGGMLGVTTRGPVTVTGPVSLYKRARLYSRAFFIHTDILKCIYLILYNMYT